MSGMTQLTENDGGGPVSRVRRGISSRFYESHGIGPGGERAYDRMRDLPALVALWPSELQDFTPPGTQKIVSRIQRALRAERARGQSGHWAYDLQRHLALVRAYKAEVASLPPKPARRNQASGAV